MKRNSVLRDFKHYGMLAPFFALFAVFYLWPILNCLLLSFTKWNGVAQPEYVGLANFLKLFKEPRFGIAWLNLGKFIVIVVPVGILIALFLAIVVNRLTPRTGNVFRSLYFFPCIIPLFLAANIWRSLLLPAPIGVLNLFLELLGIKGPLWVKDPHVMVFAVCMVDIWRAVGFHFILLYAGIKGIPTEQFEAAEIDGASPAQQAFYVTIPQLEPILFLVVVNAFIGGLQAFDLPWLLSVSQWNSVGDPQFGMLFPVMDIVWRAWGPRLGFGDASAYAFLLLVVTLLITLAQFTWRRLRRFAM